MLLSFKEPVEQVFDVVDDLNLDALSSAAEQAMRLAHQVNHLLKFKGHLLAEAGAHDPELDDRLRDGTRFAADLVEILFFELVLVGAKEGFLLFLVFN